MADNTQSSVQEAIPLTSIVMSQTRRQIVPDKATRIPEVVTKLLQWKTDYEDEGESCPICFESFKEVKADADGNDPCSDALEFTGEHEGSIVVTPCNHKFGDLCLGSWLLQKDSCPMCRNVILPIEQTQSINRVQVRQRSRSNESQRTTADIQPMAPTSPLTRSTSLNNLAVTTPFELQLWNARLGYLSHDVNEAGNPGAGGITLSNVRSPPLRSGTTIHGHPATPTSTTVEPEFIRRTYNANITTYDLPHRPSNNQLSYPTRPSINTTWRNWDYTSRDNLHAGRRQRRTINSVATAVGVSAGLGSVIGMPRAERRVSRGGENTSTSRTASDNDHSIFRAMSHAMGLGTVVGMPRAEWRSTMRPLLPLDDSRRPLLTRSESADDSSTETLTATRSRESSSVEEDLRRLPGLASSMWART